MDFFKITDTVKHILLEHVKNKDVAIDFTLGRGNDTIFLSEYFNYVYSFDVQPECIEEFSHRNIENVNLILESHEYFDKYVKNFDCGMYNLGYLPCSDKLVRTQKDSTIRSLEKAIDLLNVGGFISIMLYVGHEGGLDESNAVLELCSRLDNKRFNVAYLNLINKKTPPSLVLINKMR